MYDQLLSCRLYSDFLYFGQLKYPEIANARSFHKMCVKEMKMFSDCVKQYSLRACQYSPDLKKDFKVTTIDI